MTGSQAVDTMLLKQALYAGLILFVYKIVSSLILLALLAE